MGTVAHTLLDMMRQRSMYFKARLASFSEPFWANLGDPQDGIGKGGGGRRGSGTHSLVRKGYPDPPFANPPPRPDSVPYNKNTGGQGGGSRPPPPPPLGAGPPSSPASSG